MNLRKQIVNPLESLYIYFYVNRCLLQRFMVIYRMIKRRSFEHDLQNLVMSIGNVVLG